MEKFNVEKLKLTSDEVLERSQMKKITGGYGTHNYSCRCSGSVGPWTGYYRTPLGALNAISTWCASGYGSCTYGSY